MRHDLDLLMVRRVQRGPSRGYRSTDHRSGPDDVGAGLGLGDRLLGQRVIVVGET
jgi:hypothetical protein